MTSTDTDLVLGVIGHGWLPLAVHLIVPIVGLDGVGIGDVLGLVPVFGLRVLLIIDLLAIVPVIGLLRFRILSIHAIENPQCYMA